MKQPPVTIIMRSFNEAWALRDTLPALEMQSYRNWQLIVIDSGSTDGSQELIRAAHPLHFIEIEPGTYIPGKVLNRGMELADTELCIFLNADATPQDENWLSALVEALSKPGVGACFGCQIPRPDCEAVYACDYERCFGKHRESASWDHFFSMVSSGVRRSVWKERPFREDLQYAEDDEYTRWCRNAGYEIAYAAESIVMHSHNYTAPEIFKRSFGDAKAIAKSSPGKIAPSWVSHVALGWVKDFKKDLHYCVANGRVGELPHAMQIRWHQRRGNLAGTVAGLESAAASR